MPIYAYRCESCGHAKDVLQKVSDPLLTVCPACHAETFKKQLTAAGFQLKGSGWYVTDFRGGNTAAKGTPAADGDKPGEATKADAAKPDANKPDAAKPEPSSGSSSGGSPSASSSSGDSAPAASGGGSCASH